jgi:serine/threonine-protein kinase
MLTEATGVGDHIRILDFGLSKLRTATLDADMTGSIKVIGTPAYMSPEQASGRDVDVRSDIYSAGAVLFEMLSGKKPFEATNMLDVLKMHKEQPPPYLREFCTTTKFSAEIEAVIVKAMAKKPKERFQSALEFSAALDGTPEASMPLLRMYGTAKKEPTKSRSMEIPAKRVLQPKSAPRRIWLWILLLAVVAGAVTWFRWGGGMAFLRELELLGAGKSSKERIETPSVVSPKPAKPATSGPLVADAEAAPDSAAPDSAAPDSAAPDSAAPDSETLADSEESDEESDEESVDGEGDDESTDEEEPASTKEASRRASKETTSERREDAIARYLKLHKKKPRIAHYAYMLGKLYFDKRWWGEGMKYYSVAIRNDRNCRKWRRINRDLITALASSKMASRASHIIVNQIGRPALPYLERAAKRHEFNSVKQRAKKLIKRIRAER